MNEDAVKIVELETKIILLENDCMTMMHRLMGCDKSSFAPETLEVYERWEQKIAVMVYAYQERAKALQIANMSAASRKADEEKYPF